MKRLALFVLPCLLVLSAIVWQAGAQGNCLMFQIPVVTHGPDGPQRLVEGQTLKFTVTSPTNDPGIGVFNDNGSNLGLSAIPGLATQGISYSTPNGTMTAIACNDDIWDINLVIRRNGYTIGDKVTVYSQQSDGSGRVALVTFTVESDGVRLTQIFDQNVIYVTTSNRGLPSPTIFLNDIIPFTQPGGTQTPLITFNTPMSINCEQLVLEIMRGAGAGTTSVIFSDIIVKRMGATLNGPGIRPDGTQTGPVGPYPTELVCPVSCPTCPTPTPTPTPSCPIRGVNYNVTATATITELSNNKLCLTIANTTTSPNSGTITNIGFDLPGNRPNNYVLVPPSTNSNYAVVHDLKASSGAQNFVNTFDFVLHNKSNGNKTFGGGKVAGGIAAGQSASFCLTGDFSNLTLQQVLQSIVLRYQAVNGDKSDVARATCP